MDDARRALLDALTVERYTRPPAPQTAPQRPRRVVHVTDVQPDALDVTTARRTALLAAPDSLPFPDDAEEATA